MLTALRSIRDRLESLESDAHEAVHALEGSPDMPVTLELSGPEAAVVLRALSWHVYLALQMAQGVTDDTVAEMGVQGEVDASIAAYHTELDVMSAITARYVADMSVPDTVPDWLSALGDEG